MFVPLEELAQVSLGYKSLQNDFFYINAATIETYGIEERYLVPILMRRDLQPALYLQQAATTTWLFHCQDRIEDLRGTGALRYIESMAVRTAAEKKQSSGKSPNIREVLQAQGGGLWYAPKAAPHKRHIWIRKGINAVFAPLLFQEPALVDQRFNSVSAHTGVATWEEVAAVLTLTAFAYSVEINGSSSMGAGVLEATTTKVRGYPVLDVRALENSARAELVSLARAAWTSEAPLDWSEPKVEAGPRQRALDQWMIERSQTKVTLERLYADLHQACLARIGLAKDKVKKVNKKKTDNVGNVADSIVEKVKPRIDSKNFPEYFLQDAPLDIPFPGGRERIRSVRTQTMLGEVDVLCVDAKGGEVYKGTCRDAVAECIVRAILWGRHSFQVTSDGRRAHAALVEFRRWTKDIEQAITRAIADSALGTGYEEQLKAAVFGRLGINPLVFEATLPAVIDLDAQSP